MTKVKRFFAGLMAMVACFASAAFVACDKDDNKGGGTSAADSYVIYVTDAEGEAMADVQIGICDYDTGRCATPKKTDEDGKVVFNETKATYVLNSYVSTPSGYEWKEEYQFTEYGEYTVVLVEAE